MNNVYDTKLKRICPYCSRIVIPGTGYFTKPFTVNKFVQDQNCYYVCPKCGHVWQVTAVINVMNVVIEN